MSLIVLSQHRTTLNRELTAEQAQTIVDRLAALFNVSTPQVVFDSKAPDGLIAFAYPALNEIHFGMGFIPWNAPFHEFAHVLFYDYTGSVEKVTSEAFAQSFAAMSLTQGQDLLNFSCLYCEQSKVEMLSNGFLQCLQCGAQYQPDLY